jgi:hypothetical protein
MHSATNAALREWFQKTKRRGEATFDSLARQRAKSR